MRLFPILPMKGASDVGLFLVRNCGLGAGMAKATLAASYFALGFALG